MADAIGTLIGIAVLAGAAWASLGPLLARRYPRNPGPDVRDPRASSSDE